MIRTLYFICIIFVKNIIIYIVNINSESSRVIFSFVVFLQWVKHFCTPANFVTICSTVLNNNKKIFIYTTYILICQNCTLIFSRTRKQNWSILCQCYLRIWRAGRGMGVELEVLKCFVRGGKNFFYLLCVCVWGKGGQVQYFSFREKNNRPPPINK